MVWHGLEEYGLTYLDEITESRLFDLALLEFVAGFWMEGGDLQEITDVLDLPDDNRVVKLLAEYELLTTYGDLFGYSFTSPTWSFYFCALLDEGTYEYDFSFLRDALEEIGLEGALDESDADTENYLRNFILTDEQREKYSFIPGHYEALDSWSKETNQEILFIGGDLDPWNPLYVSGEGNPSFHKYICQGKSHSVQISDFDQDTQNEIIEILKSWVE